MEFDSFGAAFGRLVKRKRADLRLTQGQLAESVWPGDANAAETRKADISKLENGKTANPQTTTVNRIAAALEIAPEEIDALRRQAQMSPTEQLATIPTLTRDQLELLASRFEIERSYSLSDVALRQQLDQKAQEYRALREQVAGLDERVAAIANLKGAVADAVERLDFEEVENLLSRVDEVETEIAAETKETRAGNALLRGRVEQAYAIFMAAADSFGGVDLLEVARRKVRYEDQLYQHGLRYGGNGLVLAAEMNRAALTTYTKTDHPVDWAMTQQNLALALGDQGKRTVGEGGATLLTAVMPL